MANQWLEEETVDALAQRALAQAEERTLAAADGRYITGTSDAQLMQALLDVETRLMETTDLGTALEFESQAEAITHYLRRSNRSIAVQYQGAALKLRAWRRVGELLDELPRGHGGRVSVAGGLAEGDSAMPTDSEYRVTLRQLGLAERTAQRFQEVARVEQEVFAQYVPPVDTLRETIDQLFDQDAGPVVADQLERHDLTIRGLLRHARRIRAESGGTRGSNGSIGVSPEAIAAPSGGPLDEWLSPSVVLDATVDVLGGIILDPAADRAHHVPADRHFSVDDDALERPWHARRLYLHPPHSEAADFLQKLGLERRAGRVSEAIALLAAPLREGRWDAPWWQLLAPFRFCLVAEDVQAPYALTMALYLGPNDGAFTARFSALGAVCQTT